MPLYDYACSTCGTFEVSQRISEPRLSACPTCGAPVQRLVSGAAFTLKGGGWYRDGYGASGGKPSGKGGEGGQSAA